MSKKRGSVLLFFLFLLHISFFLQAETRIVTLVFDHKEMRAYIDLGNNKIRGSQTLMSGEKHFFEIRSHEKMNIELRHPNPVLYEYKWKGIEKEKTPDYQAALNLAKMLADVFKPFEKKSIQRNIDLLKVTETQQKDYLTTLQKKLENLKISDLIDSVNRSIQYTEQIPSLKLKSLGSDDEVEEAKAEVRQWNMEALEKNILECYRKIDEFQISLIRNPDRKNYTPITSSDEEQEENKDQDEKKDKETLFDDLDLKLILFAKDQQSNILKTLESLKTFASAFLKINNVMTLDKIDYSSIEYARGSIEINSLDDKMAEKPKLGKYEIVVEPFSPVRFTFAPTLVYSFVKGEDGKQIGLITPWVLGIIPKKWDNPIFGGEFQLGIRPEEEKRGFFAGLGIIIYDKIFLGGGVTYQKVNKDDYKLSVYLSLAYELK